MEQRIKAQIEKQLNAAYEALVFAKDSLGSNSMNGVIGALIEEDKRIVQIINLCQTLRDFGAVEEPIKTYDAGNGLRVTIPEN